MSATLIICTSCGYDADQPQATRPGQQFADALSQALQENQSKDLCLQTYTCLMACQHQCTAQLRSQNKIGYTLGSLSANDEAVSGLLRFCNLYQQSATGQVPYKEWPEIIKGKFIARFPPLNAQGKLLTPNA